MQQEFNASNIDDKLSYFYLNNDKLLIESLNYGNDKLNDIAKLCESLKLKYSNGEYGYLFDAILKMETFTVKYTVLFKWFFDSYNKYKEGGQSRFCLPALNLCIKSILICWSGAEDALEKLTLKYQKCDMVKLEAELSRLSNIDSISNVAMSSDINDIFYQNPGSDDWNKLKSIISVYSFEGLEKKVSKIGELLNMIRPGLSKALKCKNEFASMISAGFYIFVDFFNKKRASTRGLLLFNTVPLDVHKKIVNFPENKYLFGLIKPNLTSIKYAKAIYVPILLPPCTVNDYKQEHFVLQENGQPTGYFTDKKKYDPTKNVKVRLISPVSLPKKDKQGNWVWKKEITKIIVHIHGGGFISMSSRSHQTYTRKWAKKCNAIVFSIDYRLAPEYSYPDPITDCLNAYYWIVTYATTYLGIKPDKIIIAGDSAGGNLCLALGLRIMKTDLKKPCGLLCGYPAMSTSINTFYPSLLFSMTDQILGHSMLMKIMQCYTGEGNPEQDPYLSPTSMKDSDIQMLPKITMFLCGKDPLRDESFKYCLRAAY